MYWNAVYVYARVWNDVSGRAWAPLTGRRRKIQPAVHYRDSSDGCGLLRALQPTNDSNCCIYTEPAGHLSVPVFTSANYTLSLALACFVQMLRVSPHRCRPSPISQPGRPTTCARFSRPVGVAWRPTQRAFIVARHGGAQDMLTTNKERFDDDFACLCISLFYFLRRRDTVYLL